MSVPAQTPKLLNNEWIIFIKDESFATLYEAYLRNFDVLDRQKKEYSVIWFRHIWRKLNFLAGEQHTQSLSVDKIENEYRRNMPPYGYLQFEAKTIYSRHDGKSYNVLIIDSFNLKLPYADRYGGKRITLREDYDKIKLTKNQLRKIIQESIKKYLNTI